MWNSQLKQPNNIRKSPDQKTLVLYFETCSPHITDASALSKLNQLNKNILKILPIVKDPGVIFGKAFLLHDKN